MGCLVRTDGGDAENFQLVWPFPVSLLLICGMIGCGAEPHSAGEVAGARPGAAAPTAPFKKSVAAQMDCSLRLGLPAEITNCVGMKFALIPAGEFLMGSNPGLWDEERQHKVRISKPFYFGLYEVTQAEYEKVLEGNPGWFSAGGGGAALVSGEDTSSYPVEMVSWEQVVEFCERLSAKEGKSYRLPTEAEWEYACRAGTVTKYYCGDNEDQLKRVAWYEKNSADVTHSVGMKEANAWGLFDMHGNVLEWCQDWWGPYSGSEVMDPRGWGDRPHVPLETLNRRVARGGSWRHDAATCSAAYRSPCEPQSRSPVLGFRVVTDPPVESHPEPSQRAESLDGT